MDFITDLLSDTKQKHLSDRVHQNRMNQKKEILKSAFRLFAEKGYYKTTLEDIASELGITRAALYRYFSSKNELLFKCHELVYEYQLGILEDLHNIVDPASRLAKMLESHILLYIKNDYPFLFPILISIHSLPEEYKTQILAFRKKIEQPYYECIQEWREKYPQQLKNIDNKTLVNTLLSAANAVPRWWDNKNDPQIIAKQVVSILLDGIQIRD